jgi:hypothetical protein
MAEQHLKLGTILKFEEFKFLNGNKKNYHELYGLGIIVGRKKRIKTLSVVPPGEREVCYVVKWTKRQVSTSLDILSTKVIKVLKDTCGLTVYNSGQKECVCDG